MVPTCVLGSVHFRSVPAEAGYLFVVAACVHGVFISGDRL